MYSDRQKELSVFLRQLQLSAEEKPGESFEIVYRRDATGMIEKIWKVAQIQNLLSLREKYKIPQEVAGAIERLIEILDTVYGPDRDVDSDDGGYVLLLLPDSDTDDTDILYHRLLEKHGLRYGTAEMKTVICRYDGFEWYMELYLTTNDYGVTVIYPK